jgi:hypothetical protein
MRSGLFLLACCLVDAAVPSTAPSGEEILAQLALRSAMQRTDLVGYSSLRDYSVTNLRFGKQATVAVQMTYQQGDGAQFTVVTRSGSEKLVSVVDKVIASEVDASRPPDNARYQITPANYEARLLGREVMAGERCYVLELLPRMKSKYLIRGKAWVKAQSYELVRVEGQVAASVSLLLGKPVITQEFVEVAGYWLPARTHAVSSTVLLGTSELEIIYRDYRLSDRSLDNVASAYRRAARSRAFR